MSTLEAFRTCAIDIVKEHYAGSSEPLLLAAFRLSLTQRGCWPDLPAKMKLSQLVAVHCSPDLDIVRLPQAPEFIAVAPPELHADILRQLEEAASARKRVSQQRGAPEMNLVVSGDMFRAAALDIVKRHYAGNSDPLFLSRLQPLLRDRQCWPVTPIEASLRELLGLHCAADLAIVDIAQARGYAAVALPEFASEVRRTLEAKWASDNPPPTFQTPSYPKLQDRPTNVVDLTTSTINGAASAGVSTSEGPTPAGPFLDIILRLETAAIRRYSKEDLGPLLAEAASLLALEDTAPATFLQAMRLVQYFRLVAEYREHHALHQGDISDILFKAARTVAPPGCDHSVCLQVFPPRCIALSESNTLVHRMMCAYRLESLALANNYRALRENRVYAYDVAAALRQRAVDCYSIFQVLRPDAYKPAHHRHLRFWHAVSAYCLALTSGDFQKAMHWLDNCAEESRWMDEHRTFPNFFGSKDDILNRKYYVRAIQHIKENKFSLAREQYELWLTHGERQATKFYRDNIRLFRSFCYLLENIPYALPSAWDWEQTERAVQKSYASVNARAIWQQLQRFRSVYAGPMDNDLNAAAHLLRDVSLISQQWSLFVLEARIEWSYKRAGRQSDYFLPTPFDIARQVSAADPDWREIVRQNVRNFCIWIAEYEYGRYISSFGVATAPAHNLALQPLWSINPDTDVVRMIDLVRRWRRKQGFREGALQVAYEQIDRACATGSFDEAIRSFENFCRTLGEWPHLIRVISVEVDASTTKAAGETVVQARFIHTAERKWAKGPEPLRFARDTALRETKWYTMNRRWNRRDGSGLMVLRTDHFGLSELSPYFDLYSSALYQDRQFLATRFRQWIFQFPPKDRLRAIKLLAAMRFYDENRMRRIWANVFSRLPSHALEECIIVGLGHGAKSGRLNPYLFRQAATDDARYERLIYGRERQIFRDLAEVDENSDKGKRPRSVVFLDDFLATGSQATRLLNGYTSRHPWLTQCTIHLCTLVAFRSAIDYVRVQMDGRLHNVYSGDVLEEKDRAFAVGSELWSGDDEREQARRWAEQLGAELLHGHPIYDPERDGLGWRSCEALVAFSHNIPNDTLPLFWAKGHPSTRNWFPLFDRYD
jgi:hypothetical protein